MAKKKRKGLYIVFDNIPDPKGGRFVEVEDEQGRSIDLGENYSWKGRPDGLWEIGPFDRAYSRSGSLQIAIDPDFRSSMSLPLEGAEQTRPGDQLSKTKIGVPIQVDLKDLPSSGGYSKGAVGIEYPGVAEEITFTSTSEFKQWALRNPRLVHINELYVAVYKLFYGGAESVTLVPQGEKG